MTSSHPARFIAAALAVAVVLLSQPLAARAQSLEELKDREASAKRAVDEMAAKVTEAIGEWNAIHHEIEQIESVINAKQAKANDLGTLAVDRAVEAYKGRSNQGLEILDSTDLLEASRRARLLGHVTQKDSETIDKLNVEATDLATDEERLQHLKEEQQRIIDERRAAEDELERRFQKLNAERVALEERLAAQRRAAGQSSGSGGPAPPAPAPVGGLVCPSPQSSFTDSYGAPRSGGRSHKGVDMMAPFGAPLYAVTSGSIGYRAGGLAGKAAWLHGSDGNLYFYAHLQDYVGGSRQVSQGELIGTNGNTGNASGGSPHLHFEIKIGGSTTVNPYPTVARIC